MKITSYGAAENVTGSKHLLEINGHRILLDCGLFLGSRKKMDLKNRNFPLDGKTIDTVVLSHAHIDHSGVLPVLGKTGFRGRIYTTNATRDLCSVMLQDSAKIQVHDARWLSKKSQSFVPPLYEPADVFALMDLFISVPYGLRFEIAPDVFVTLQDAGHVLGSAIVCLDFKEGSTPRRLLFTGDLGRKNMPILRDPWEPDGADIAIMESTYGDRDHDPIETMERELAEVIRSTHGRGGKVIIPSFALERAQEIIYSLKRLEMREEIPQIPVYVDSPLTVNVTEVFRLHTECFDEDMRRVMLDAGDAFRLGHIEYIRNVEASMRLNSLKGPAIIISAAGMCEHGRILHHLRNNCENPNNTILIVGFQAKNTLGRRIVERQPEIRILGVKHPLKAQVKVMNALSAHAGRTELIDFGKRFKDPGQHVLLVHGDEKALKALGSALETEGVKNVSVQREGVTVEL